jgi:putative transposase
MPHALTSNLVHCTFSTKNRTDSIPDPATLGRYLGGVAKGKGIPLIIAGGTKNHIHLLIALPPSMPLSRAI